LLKAWFNFKLTADLNSAINPTKIHTESSNVSTYVATLHSLSNHLIVFADDGKTAASEIVFAANHWKKSTDGSGKVKVVNAGSNGRYLDKWRRDCDGNFRIYHRTICYDNESSIWKNSVDVAGKFGLVQAKDETIGIHGMQDWSYANFGTIKQPQDL